MRIYSTAPARFLLLATGTWLIIFFLTRLFLFSTHMDEAGTQFFATFATGLLYDLAFLSYAAVPLGIYVFLCPPVLWRARGHRWFLQGVMTLSIFVMLFVSVAEWLFWDEFGGRFNFIAVDYLVYSDEVLNNILESYPVGKLLGILALVAIVVSLLISRAVAAAVKAPLPSYRGRLAASAYCYCSRVSACNGSIRTHHAAWAAMPISGN
ncbi:Sulfatase protein [Pseudomonas savastanoi]|nr:Sulfatase [Pseudomonas amygdali pv. ciccaronei]KPY73560.1 Sulfatase [Pseudomonas savastanoi pv. savastanoi]KUG41455.1 Sulfatase [Pseudomonas savastanoi pv. fraxini]RML97200.1 Sulfatase protein [Pseudomonas savastanoi]